MRYLFILSLLVLCSCSSDMDSRVLPEVPADAIALYSNIGSISAGQTRGEGVISSTLTAHLPVNFVRVDKPLDGSYPANYPTTGTPEEGIFVDKLQAKIIKDNGVVSFIEYYTTSDLRHIYRSDKGYTKLIGWYPQTGEWSVSSGTGKVTFPTLDGTTDILTTTTVEGSKVDPFDTRDAKKLKFSHVLTQVRVFAYLENANYQNLWGNLSSLALVGKAQVCTLTLPAANATVGNKPTVAFTGTGNLLLQKPDNSGAVSNVALPTSKPDPDQGAVPLGYAMIAPLSASEKLTLRVTTVKGGAQDVVLSPNTAFPLEAGKSYNIFLKLQATKIEGTASIAGWIPGGSITGNL